MLQDGENGRGSPSCRNVGDVVHETVSTILGERVRSVTPIVGKGIVNLIFLVETSESRVIARLNDHDHALLDYQKEAWCMAQAAARGIPGPSVLAMGKRGEHAFMLQSYVDGVNGEDSSLDKRILWRNLGRHVRLLRTIPVQGFGENLADANTGRFEAPLHEGFDGTWRGYVDYNIRSLTDEDPLLDLGVCTRTESRALRTQFKELYTRSLDVGLNHGDVSRKNTVVTPDGTVYLLDWGSAVVSASPYEDMIQVLRCHLLANDPTASEYAAFIEGYGWTSGEYEEVAPLIHRLMLLRAVDKLRWAIDCSPGDVHRFAQSTKMMLEFVCRKDSRIF